MDAALVSANASREEISRQTGEDIKRAQKKLERDYESRNKFSASIGFYIGAEVLLRNKKRKYQNGGKFIFKWLWPYVV